MKVQRLSEDLVNKIAAGEVVERPASVVKELVENALDAGATKISVELESGGKVLVRVRDDGHGMGRDDAELALERHATSKLRALEDLQSVATNGFRGEALPAIASVSNLLLRTRLEGDAAGTEIEIRHGRREHVRDTGHPRGTTIEVRDLFGGVPARRKFLRADSTETGHVAEALTLLALARPGTGFTLKSGERTLIEAPAVDGLAARLFQLFGRELLDTLAVVEGGESWAQVRGLVSKLGTPGPARPNLRLFVNGRPVRDRALSKAVAQGYKAAGGGERSFEAFLFLDVPLHMVDVNVHPAKTEVRFSDPRSVWSAVERVVTAGLSAAAREAAPIVGASGAAQVAESVERYLTRAADAPSEQARFAWGRGSAVPSLAGQLAPPATAALFPNGPPTALGQHRNTYIVVSDGQDLILVDQHTAHERARFEQLQARVAARAVEAQMLLVPAVVTLPPALLAVFEEHAEGLRELGFDAELFGGTTLRVRALPSVLGARDPGPALQGLLKDFLERDSADWTVSATRDRLAATLACHSAVRAGQPLGPESMLAIVTELAACEHPTLCPHGRPTIVRVPGADVSRWFGRVGWRRS
jgi:DNA mismatch repair protein MutL